MIQYLVCSLTWSPGMLRPPDAAFMLHFRMLLIMYAVERACVHLHVISVLLSHVCVCPRQRKVL